MEMQSNSREKNSTQTLCFQFVIFKAMISAPFFCDRFPLIIHSSKFKGKFKVGLSIRSDTLLWSRIVRLPSVA